MPFLPSSPMPVSTTPAHILPNSWAAEANISLTDGMNLSSCLRGINLSILLLSRNIIEILYPPGHTKIVPCLSGSLSSASLTLRLVYLFSLCAKVAVKPGGMCCETITPIFIFLSRPDITLCNAEGPPVEEPIAINLNPA